MNATYLSGLMVLVGAAAALAGLGYLHYVERELSPITAAVSQYGITSHRAGYRWVTVAMGAAGLCAIASLQLGSRPLLAGLLVIFGLGRLLISWFPMDAPGSDPNRTGRIHNLLAVAAFAAIAVAAILLPTDNESGGVLPPWSAPLGWTMTMAAAVLLVGRLSQPVHRLFGLVERVLYAAMLTWLVMSGLTGLSAG